MLVEVVTVALVRGCGHLRVVRGAGGTEQAVLADTGTLRVNGNIGGAGVRRPR